MEEYKINEEGQLEVTKTVVEVYESKDILESQLASFTAQRDEAQANMDATIAKIEAYNK